MIQLTKEIVAKAVIEEIKKNNGNSAIETRWVKSFYHPAKLVWKSSQSGYIPDIKVSSPEGNSDIYEIELSENYNEEKWRLFALYAKKLRGRFILIVPESKVDKISSKLTKNKIHNTYLIAIKD